MKVERSNIEFPLWRKKVDSSLFEHQGTVIPKWAVNMWNLSTHFPEKISKSDPKSKVEILFNRRSFLGQVTQTWPKNRSDRVYRLWFGDDLKTELQDTYPMSFMRDIERRLQKQNKSYASEQNIEDQIPFWEFLDIEFDEHSVLFRFVPHYTQKPTFPELFKRLSKSPALKKIDDELNQKEMLRIHKQDWRPREEFETEVGADNIIYMLADTTSKLLYIGEAQNLIRRLRSGHPIIKNWDQYRYDVLPDTLAPYRIQLERMLIRAYAATFTSTKALSSLGVSEYKLVNEKIDR